MNEHVSTIQATITVTHSHTHSFTDGKVQHFDMFLFGVPALSHKLLELFSALSTSRWDTQEASGLFRQRAPWPPPAFDVCSVFGATSKSGKKTHW